MTRKPADGENSELRPRIGIQDLTREAAKGRQDGGLRTEKRKSQMAAESASLSGSWDE